MQVLGLEMTPPGSRTLYELLREQAERFPGRIAVICGERQATYRDLADAAGRIAVALRAAGLRRGERIGMLINNRLEWLETCFGAAALGVVVVPLSTWSKPDELAYLLADSEIAALFAVKAFAGQDFGEMLTALVPEGTRSPPGGWRSREFPRLRTTFAGVRTTFPVCARRLQTCARLSPSAHDVCREKSLRNPFFHNRAKQGRPFPCEDPILPLCFGQVEGDWSRRDRWVRTFYRRQFGTADALDHGWSLERRKTQPQDEAGLRHFPLRS